MYGEPGVGLHVRGDTLQLRNYETAGYDQSYGIDYAYGLVSQVVRHQASGGVDETFRYDRDGRRTWRQLVVGGTTQMRDTLTYDARGKILRADNLSSVFTQWYAGLGALWATDWANLADNARNREEFTVDPLGHVARRRTSRDQQDVTEPTDWITRYEPHSSAVQRVASVWPPNTPGFRADSTEQERDARGNLWRDREWGWGVRWTGVTGITRMSEARHFYDAGQRLRVVQRQGGVGCGLVAWPGWQTNAYHALSQAPPASENWRGGLVDGMRDATGQMYKRNRYYDPGTGQFTQPDPIGIAGGLNVYGFADGDPVSYSDPYGLAPCSHLRNAYLLALCLKAVSIAESGIDLLPGGLDRAADDLIEAVATAAESEGRGTRDANAGVRANRSPEMNPPLRNRQTPVRRTLSQAIRTPQGARGGILRTIKAGAAGVGVGLVTDLLTNPSTAQAAQPRQREATNLGPTAGQLPLLESEAECTCNPRKP